MPKRCGTCTLTKPVDEFYLVNRTYKDKTTGLPVKKKVRHSKCKDCHRKMARKHYDANAETYKARNKDWRSLPENRQRQRRTHRRNTYSLSDAEFKRMKKRQKGCCAICEEPFLRGGKVYVDHCHKTKFVRELLDNGCNVILGHAGDDPTVLVQRGYLKHAEYVRKWVAIHALREREENGSNDAGDTGVAEASSEVVPTEESEEAS